MIRISLFIKYGKLVVLPIFIILLATCGIMVTEDPLENIDLGNVVPTQKTLGDIQVNVLAPADVVVDVEAVPDPTLYPDSLMVPISITGVLSDQQTALISFKNSISFALDSTLAFINQDGYWEAVDSTLDSTGHTISAVVNNFSIWGVIQEIAAADPVVSFITPTDGSTISGVFQIKVSADDANGIEKVEIYKDGTLIDTLTEPVNSEYIYNWDTSAIMGLTTAELNAVAYDLAGNSTTVIISVNITNYSFSRAYGGNGVDSAYSSTRLTDGTMIFVGETSSSNLGAGGANGWDGFILQTDENGSRFGDRVLGTALGDSLQSIFATQDGGAVAAGNFGGDFGVVKFVDAAPGIELPGSGDFGSGYSIDGFSDLKATAIIEDNDVPGAYYVAGYGKYGSVNDIFVTKITDITSAPITFGWCWRFDGLTSGDDQAMAVIESSEGSGNFILVAGIMGGSVSSDIWILKIMKNTGSIVWNRTIGDPNNFETVNDIIQNNSGNYIIAGTIQNGANGYDFYVAEINPLTGEILRNTAFGGANSDSVFSLDLKSDGNYLVAGETSSFTAAVQKGWAVTLDKTDLSIISERYFSEGVGSPSLFRTVVQSTDDKAIYGGQAFSSDTSTTDLWILQTIDTATVLGTASAAAVSTPVYTSADPGGAINEAELNVNAITQAVTITVRSNIPPTRTDFYPASP